MMSNQTERVANHLHRTLPEWVDSYLIIGESVDGEPLALMGVASQEQADRINRMVFAIAAAGGVKFEEQKEGVEV